MSRLCLREALVRRLDRRRLEHESAILGGNLDVGHHLVLVARTGSVRDIRVAVAQFEHRNGDKAYNLSRIEELTRRAVEQGAEIVSFHECSISGYTFLQHLSRDELADLAEPVPDGPSIATLVKIARDAGVVVMAGLVELDSAGRLFNCYVTVGPEGFITRFRKLHTFISPYLSAGRFLQCDRLCWASRRAS